MNIGSRGGTSQFCGVDWVKKDKKWRARCHDAVGRCHHLGLFTEEINAGRAYDAFASEHHGAFARLNFPAAMAAT